MYRYDSLAVTPGPWVGFDLALRPRKLLFEPLLLPHYVY
jgi:hypothetical protein